METTTNFLENEIQNESYLNIEVDLESQIAFDEMESLRNDEDFERYDDLRNI